MQFLVDGSGMAFQERAISTRRRDISKTLGYEIPGAKPTLSKFRYVSSYAYVLALLLFRLCNSPIPIAGTGLLHILEFSGSV